MPIDMAGAIDKDVTYRRGSAGSKINNNERFCRVASQNMYLPSVYLLFSHMRKCNCYGSSSLNCNRGKVFSVLCRSILFPQP